MKRWGPKTSTMKVFNMLQNTALSDFSQRLNNFLDNEICNQEASL